MPPRTEGNSFHLTLYTLLTRWMPTTIFFSVSGRFILIPDIDRLDSALSSATTAASTPMPLGQEPFASNNTRDSAVSPSLLYSVPNLPKIGYGGRILSMGSYNSMRRQLCAYNFYAIEPQTLSPSELPEGIVLNSKSRVWFHVHFYRGATSWHNVPRMAWTKRKQSVATAARLSPPVSPQTIPADSPVPQPIGSTPSSLITPVSSPPTLSSVEEAASSQKVFARKSALTYRDAIEEIERVSKISTEGSPLPTTTTPPSGFQGQSSWSPSMIRLPAPALATAPSIPMQPLQPIPLPRRVNKLSLTYLLNSSPRSNPY